MGEIQWNSFGQICKVNISVVFSYTVLGKVCIECHVTLSACN